MLSAYSRLAPDISFTHYDGISALPHFNPDLDCDERLPAEVIELREMVTRVDAVVISTPEYVHALPGSFKNILDWLVSDPAFVGKPVVILHADRGSSWALDSLREVLRTMSAEIVDSATALLPLGSNHVDEEGILARDDLRRLLEQSVQALRTWYEQKTHSGVRASPATHGSSSASAKNPSSHEKHQTR